MAHLINKDAIKHKVQEKLLNACERHYEAERALCELAVPQSWKDEAKAAWEEFVLRYQDYELVFKYKMDITNEDLNYDDYETDRQIRFSSGDREDESGCLTKEKSMQEKGFRKDNAPNRCLQ